MIFDALSNAAYRVSLRGPGVELEGAINDTPSGDEKIFEAQLPGRGLKIRAIHFVCIIAPLLSITEGMRLIHQELLLGRRLECFGICGHLTVPGDLTLNDLS